MRAEALFEGANTKPILLVLSRGAPPRSVGSLLAQLKRGTAVELAYWDDGVRAVRAQVGWTRVQIEGIRSARALELGVNVSPVAAQPDAITALAKERSDASGAAPKAAVSPAAFGEDKALDGGPVEALKLGHMGAVALARTGSTSRVTISAKELLFNDLSGDARLPLRGYASNRKGATMQRWRARLVQMAGLLPKQAAVMLYVRGDAPMDAVLELIGALAPRPVNLSFPHQRVEVVEDDLYAPAAAPPTVIP
jgi:hypothetical protein